MFPDLRSRRATIAVTASLLVLTLAVGQTRAAPTDTARDALADEGEIALTRLGCTSCHTPMPTVLDRLRPWPAPRLDEIGARVSAAWLAAFLDAPPADSRMPDVLGGLPEPERARAIDDLVQYLIAHGGPFAVAPVHRSSWRVDEGEVLFGRVGCLACHEQGGLDARALAEKTSVAALAAFLVDPLHVRASGAMPAMALEADEARALASYLLRAQLESGVPERVSVRGLLVEEFLLEDWPERLPDLDALEPARITSRAEVGVGEPLRDDQFALRLTGTLHVDEPGERHLYLDSDDGSRLWLDGELVIDNDGLHGEERREATVTLDAGAHALRIEYFEAGGDVALGAGWLAERGDDATPFSSDELEHVLERWVPLGAGAFEPDVEAAARGRRLFEDLGCAACHAMPGARSPRPVIPLDRLSRFDEGCTAETVPAGLPDYGLDATTRTAIRAAIERGALHRRRTPAERVEHTIATLRCDACHARGDRPGAPDAVRATFTGTADLGDEGRVPPDLTGVGAKLRLEWLREVLVGEGRVRPYMHVRMPTFGERAVGGLAEALVAADGGETPDAPRAFDADLVEAGRRLTGTDGFSCITCHTFAGRPSLGVPAVDLATTARRLRPAWFRAWMLDPIAQRAGTRMPTYWDEGRSSVLDVLDGDAEAQIDALWRYLALGPAAPLPTGLVVDPDAYELVPVDEPVYCSVFMRDVGPRVLAVGLPENVHVAYDLARARLALGWQGRFLDVEGTWRGRAGQLEWPAGDSVRVWPAAPVVAWLDDRASPWPDDDRASGWRTGGHRRRRDGRPTFLARHARLSVEEAIDAGWDADGAYLVRRFTFGAGPDGEARDRAYLRAVVADAVDVERGAAGTTFTTGDGLRGVVRGAAAFARHADGHAELLVDLASLDGSVLELELHW